MIGYWFIGLIELIECLGRRDLLDQYGPRHRVPSNQVALRKFEHGGSNGFVFPETVIGLEARDKGLLVDDAHDLLGSEANASAVGSGPGRKDGGRRG